MAIMTAGYHDVEIIGSGLKRASTGNEQILIRFRNEGGDEITAYLATTEKAWPYTEEKLKTCGWDPQQRSFRFEELNAETSPILGNKVNISVNTEFDEQGKAHNKVNWINPLGGMGIERLEPTEAKTFADSLRARLLGKGGSTSGAAHQARRQATPGGAAKFSDGSSADDSDIPF